MESRSRSAAGAGLLVWMLAFLSVLIGWTSCAREVKKEASEYQRHVGGVNELDQLMQEALRAADPMGAVLVVVWSLDAPIPEELVDVVDRWGEFGLIPIDLCVELVDAGGNRARRLDRIRDWERWNDPGFEGLIYEGTQEVLSEWFEGGATPGQIVLMSEFGTVLWSTERYQRLDVLRDLLTEFFSRSPLA